MSQAHATRAARTLRIILTVRLTPTASAAQAMMTGMLSDEPAMVTLAHSVHIEAISVPIALGDEQFGQQVVIGGGLLVGINMSLCYTSSLGCQVAFPVRRSPAHTPTVRPSLRWAIVSLLTSDLVHFAHHACDSPCHY